MMMLLLSCNQSVSDDDVEDDDVNVTDTIGDSLWIKSIYMDVVVCDDSGEQLVLIDSIQEKNSFYLPDGRVVKEKLKIPHIGELTYQYNNHNRLINIASTIDKTIEYSYDKSDTLCIAKRYKGEKFPMETYSYYPNGNVKCVNTYDEKSGKLLMKCQHFYKRGLVVCDSVFTTDNKDAYIPLEVHLYSYNGHHDIVEELIVNSFEGNIRREYEYRLFDKQGNWLECMEYETHEFNDGEDKEITIYHLFRQIEYGTK